MAGENPGYGKNGYYLASPGSVAWDDLYGAMGTALLRHKLVDDDTVIPASEEDVEAMAAALGVPKEFVGVSLGGLFVPQGKLLYFCVFMLTLHADAPSQPSTGSRLDGNHSLLRSTFSKRRMMKSTGSCKICSRGGGMIRDYNAAI